MNPDREARFAAAAAGRLAWVHAAIECVHHRHNASAVLRSCDAFGVHHVHLVGDEHFRPATGPSKGVGRWLDLRRHATTAEALAAVRDAGLALWVADFADPPVPPAEVPVDRPLCLWFGAEMVGVSDEARAAADGVMTLPMHGFAQSLNVSVAAALALHAVTERVRAVHGATARLPRTERTRLLADWLERDEAELDAIEAEQRALALLGAAGPN